MNMELSFEQILTLMNTMAEKDLGEFLLEQGDMRLKIEGRKLPKTTQNVLSQIPIPMAVEGLGGPGGLAESAPSGVRTAPEAEAPAPSKGNVVKSPIVGTFYSAAAPDKPPYVQVGSQVKVGDVLFIVESMKLMNEVQSEFGGTVEEILVKNGQPVEYGQPIMRIV